MKILLKSVIVLLIFHFASCEKESKSDLTVKQIDNENPTYDPTPYTLELPPHFSLIPSPFIPQDNPLTEEGVALGKKLFFEKKLSKDNSLSCAGCHRPQFAFNDKGKDLSPGVGGSLGVRNAMPLFNLGWTRITNSSFNWHGSAVSLEDQALEPVKNPFEMQETWVNVINKLQNDPTYPDLFFEAFGTKEIDSTLIVKAIAQFERTLVSGDSKFDNYVKSNLGLSTNGPGLNAQEQRGLDLFIAENKGDCSHCHGDEQNPLLTDFQFRNNGLDVSPDSGLALVTKNGQDVGKFKTPSLRNLVYTAPYMHDGRFSSLEKVVDFYIDSVKVNSPNLDGFMKKNRSLNSQEREDLVAFLKSMTDSGFVQNPAFRP